MKRYSYIPFIVSLTLLRLVIKEINLLSICENLLELLRNHSRFGTSVIVSLSGTVKKTRGTSIFRPYALRISYLFPDAVYETSLSLKLFVGDCIFSRVKFAVAPCPHTTCKKFLFKLNAYTQFWDRKVSFLAKTLAGLTVTRSRCVRTQKTSAVLQI